GRRWRGRGESGALVPRVPRDLTSPLSWGAAIERAHRQPDRPVRVPRYPRPDHPAPTGAGSGSVASARLRGSALSVSTIAAEISVPIAIASANPSAPDTSGSTSTPPCGLVVAA